MSDETNELLREVVRWLRFQSLDKAKAAVAAMLDSDKKKLVFELTVPGASARSIAAKTGADRNAIARWWAAWYPAGIVTKEGEGYRRLFSLKELGIEVSDGALNANDEVESAR